MKSLKVTSMLAVLMFLFITGMQAQTVTPSKKYITKELNNVSNFSSIKVLGSTDVEYRQSSGSKQRFLYMVRTIWSICWKCLLRMECCR